MRGGQGARGGHTGQGFVGLGAESGFCFLYNERPQKGAKQK